MLACGHCQHSTQTFLRLRNDKYGNFFILFFFFLSTGILFCIQNSQYISILTQQYSITCNTTELWVLLVKNLVVPVFEDCRWADTPISLLPRDTFIWGSSSSTRDLRRWEQRNFTTKPISIKCSCILKPQSSGDEEWQHRGYRSRKLVGNRINYFWSHSTNLRR